MTAILSGENIIKTFGSENGKINALDSVSIQIDQGEFVAIMGPSGSGKSTLMFALSGMDTIDSGQVIFNDRDLSVLTEDMLADIRRTEMGFIFQQPTFLKNLNILDNVVLPFMGKGKKTEDVILTAKKLLEKTGIAELAERDITQVSGGQLQRAGICRALMNNPKIIFGDEPTGALNSKTSLEIMDLLAEINTEGTAIMMVTHDAKVAARAERLLFMSDGKIISELRLPYSDGMDDTVRTDKVTERMREVGI